MHILIACAYISVYMCVHSAVHECVHACGDWKTAAGIICLLWGSLSLTWTHRLTHRAGAWNPPLNFLSSGITEVCHRSQACHMDPRAQTQVFRPGRQVLSSLSYPLTKHLYVGPYYTGPYFYIVWQPELQGTVCTCHTEGGHIAFWDKLTPS